MKSLYDIDFEDIVSTKCPKGVTMSQVLLGFFSTDSRLINSLMKLRNKIVSLIGLKTGQVNVNQEMKEIQAGTKVGLFEVGSISSSIAIMGANDSHLNFRVILEIKNDILYCKTQVKFNNLFGRIYFFFIKPFHKIIVPTILQKTIKFINKNLNQ